MMNSKSLFLIPSEVHLFATEAISRAEEGSFCNCFGHSGLGPDSTPAEEEAAKEKARCGKTQGGSAACSGEICTLKER